MAPVQPLHFTHLASWPPSLWTVLLASRGCSSRELPRTQRHVRSRLAALESLRRFGSQNQRSNQRTPRMKFSKTHSEIDGLITVACCPQLMVMLALAQSCIIGLGVLKLCLASQTNVATEFNTRQIRPPSVGGHGRQNHSENDAHEATVRGQLVVLDIPKVPGPRGKLGRISFCHLAC